MKIMTVAETKARLSEILNQIEKGEEVTITRRGKAIARISAISPPRQPLPSLAALRQSVSSSVTPGTEVLRALREEQR